MDLRRLLTIVRAWLPFSVACVLVAMVAAYVLSSNLPKVYEARATLIVGQSLSGVSPDYNQILVSQRLSATYASVATTRPNLSAVIQKLGLTMTADELAQSVSADAGLDSTLITITVQGEQPAQAADIANAVANQLIAVSPAIQGHQSDIQASVDAELLATQQQIDATQTELDALRANSNRTATEEARLETLEARVVTLRSTYASLLAFTSGYDSNLLTLIEPAETPTVPVSPRVLLNVLLGALLGMFFAGGVILIKQHLDDTIKSPDDVETSIGLPTIGVIKRMTGERGRNEIYRLAALLYPRSPVTEAYRTLRANIEFAAVDEPIRALLLTSSIPGEGKTVTAANLAVVFAQTNRRVLLVDADLRNPGIHRIFGLPNDQGITTMLRGDGDVVAPFTHPTEQENLWVLTTGPLPANPAELLGSRRMATVLEQMKTSYDLVVIDSPPTQIVVDAAVLSSFIDATVVVVGAGKGRRGTVELARESLERAGARVIGVVLNLVRDREGLGNSGYYAAYGPGEADATTAGQAAADIRPSAGG